MSIRSRPWLYWIFLFLAVNIFFRQSGNPNPGSRFAAMASFCESRRFIIDDYVTGPLSWTNDWAHAPDGHYYSNKAPAPIILGLPAFWIVDQWVTSGLPTAQERFLARRRSLPLYNHILSIFFQVLPYALLTALLLRRLEAENVSMPALHFTALAMLFGNTASLFMNTYFGHGMAAMWLLALLLAIADGRWKWAGFFAGWAALSDYGASWVGMVLLVDILFFQMDRRMKMKEICLGLLIPLLIGGGYHAQCFGRSWRLPLLYQSPEFVQRDQILGLFSTTFHISIIGRLLFGGERGILVTQPWLLITFPIGLAFLASRKRSSAFGPWRMGTIVFSISFLGLLAVNSTFGGWHGGQTIGPRYLCMVIPALCVPAAFIYDIFNPIGRTFLWLSLAPAVILFGLVFSTTPFVPPGLPLWPALIFFLKQSLR